MVEHGAPGGLTAEDLLQDCLAHWWRQRERYDLSRGASPATFLRRVVSAKLLDIARHERAQKRGGGSAPLSLDQPLASEEYDDLTLAGIIEDPGRGPHEDAEAIELRQRIEHASRLLTPRQRCLIEGLYADRSVSDLSRALGVPRTTLYDELRRIREAFRDQGLEAYLP